MATHRKSCGKQEVLKKNGLGVMAAVSKDNSERTVSAPKRRTINVQEVFFLYFLFLLHVLYT